MMSPARGAPRNVDEYIGRFPPDVRAMLRKVRATIRAAAPEAEEVISYRMPAFRAHGILLYFAGFKHHIGLYPPVKGDASLERAMAPYAGEKGNLRFPFDRRIPYGLIGRIARLRVRQDREKSAARPRPSRRSSGTRRASR